jgi:hypothetical protein
MCHARGSAESAEGRLSSTPNQNTSYNGILHSPITDQLKPLASWAGSLSGDDQRLLFMWLTSPINSIVLFLLFLLYFGERLWVYAKRENGGAARTMT